MLNLYLVNLLISVVVFIIFKIFRIKSSNIYFLLMTIIPGIGIVFVATLSICKKIIKADNGREVLDRENEFDKSISLLIRQAELKNKKELIPIEDALELNDEHIKRKVVIEALKSDTYDYLGFLMSALKDEDTETSHYAATAVTDIRRKLTINLQKMEKEYKENKYDKEIAEEYTDIIKKCIESKLLDSKTENRLLWKNKEVLEKLVDKYGYNEEYLDEIIRLYIKLGEYDRAKFFCNNYIKNFGKSEKPYIFLLEIYYNLRDRISFNKTLKSLIESNITLDNKILKTLEFWIEGEQYV